MPRSARCLTPAYGGLLLQGVPGGQEGQNLFNRMVVQHLLGNPQGWRWRTLPGLKPIDRGRALFV